jgi:heavy-metal resistance protein
MFGFIFGTACLIGLVKLARRGGCGGGYGYYGGHGHWGRGFRGGGPQSWMLRGLSYRIGATPGQEKVIAEAFENIRTAFSKIHDEKDKARRDVATAFKQETFDHGPMKDAFTRADGILEEIQRTILVELSKVHEALNPEQRKQVADLLENGFGGGWGRHQGWGGGWRHGYRGGPWAAAGYGGRCGGSRSGGRPYDETSNNNDANVA